MNMLDEGITARLEADLGREGLTLMLQVFCQEIHDRAAQISSQMAAADLVAARVSSHALKAAARSVGAGPLGDACAAIEAACEAGELSKLDEFQGHADRVLTFLAERYDITPT